MDFQASQSSLTTLLSPDEVTTATAARALSVRYAIMTQVMYSHRKFQKEKVMH